MTNYLTVVNWENYQHYKDRNPPWIKLHRDLLRDYDFINLSDDGKLHLMLIWLLASQMDNKIPCDAAFVQKQLNTTSIVNFKELIDKGFLADASKVLASCKQSAIVETETETETETDICEKQFKKFWEIYPRKIDKKKARKSFKTAVKKSSADEVISGAKFYADDEARKSTEQSYIKHPTTWLNGECWENEKTKITISEILEKVSNEKHLRLRTWFAQRKEEDAFRKITGYGFSDIG